MNSNENNNESIKIPTPFELLRLAYGVETKIQDYIKNKNPINDGALFNEPTVPGETFRWYPYRIPTKDLEVIVDTKGNLKNLAAFRLGLQPNDDFPIPSNFSPYSLTYISKELQGSLKDILQTKEEMGHLFTLCLAKPNQGRIKNQSKGRGFFKRKRSYTYLESDIIIRRPYYIDVKDVDTTNVEISKVIEWNPIDGTPSRIVPVRNEQELILIKSFLNECLDVFIEEKYRNHY